MWGRMGGGEWGKGVGGGRVRKDTTRVKVGGEVGGGGEWEGQGGGKRGYGLGAGAGAPPRTRRHAPSCPPYPALLRNQTL